MRAPRLTKQKQKKNKKDFQIDATTQDPSSGRCESKSHLFFMCQLAEELPNYMQMNF